MNGNRIKRAFAGAAAITVAMGAFVFITGEKVYADPAELTQETVDGTYGGALPSSGEWVLSSDITVSSGRELSAPDTTEDLILDLNGKTITYTGDSSMLSMTGGTEEHQKNFTLRDSSEEKTGLILGDDTKLVGHKDDPEAPETKGGFAYITSFCNVNIEGGTISKFKATDGGSFFIGAGAAVNMTSGKISECQAEHGGGAFFVGSDETSRGALRILPADDAYVDITNNTAASGGAVRNDGGALELKNVTFGANNAIGTEEPYGGGAVMSTGSVALSGRVIAGDNTSPDGKRRNFYLGGGGVTVTGPMAPESLIGISASSFEGADITTGLGPNGGASLFVSDDPDYKVYSTPSGELRLINGSASRIAGHSVRLTSGIVVRYCVELVPDCQNPNTVMSFDVAGSHYESSFDGGRTYTYGDKTLYVFECPLKLSQMSEPISAVLRSAGTELLSDSGYSVQKYGEAVTGDTSGAYTDAQKKAVSALLNYGAFVCDYLGVATSLTKGNVSVSSSELDKYDFELPKAGDHVCYNSSSVLFENGITLRHYFSVASEDASKISVKVGDSDVPVSFKDGPDGFTFAYIDITGIAVGQIAQDYSVTVSYDGTPELSFTYSPLTYARSVILAGPSAVLDLSKALFIFYSAVSGL